MHKYQDCCRPPYVIEQEAREKKEAEKAELLLKRSRNILKELRKAGFQYQLKYPEEFNNILEKADRLELTINNWFLRNYGDPKESTLVTGYADVDDVDVPSE